MKTLKYREEITFQDEQIVLDSNINLMKATAEEI